MARTKKRIVNRDFSTDTGDSATLRALFAFFRHFECYGDFSPTKMMLLVDVQQPSEYFDGFFD
jgi:hypothetical protein